MSRSEVDELKARACLLIDQTAEALIHISHEIHDHPEQNYEEFFASELLTRTSNDLGMPVELGAFDCATGFSGDIGSGPAVCIMSEYDALPDIGHGCGHNIIAAQRVLSRLLPQTLAVVFAIWALRLKKVVEEKFSWREMGDLLTLNSQ
jgi:metal-dependent amidase/aminoacylase/carboxypeptidase family protein